MLLTFYFHRGARWRRVLAIRTCKHQITQLNVTEDDRLAYPVWTVSK